MTTIESARLRLPHRSDDALDYLLWNVTCFPFGKPRRWLGQLVAFDYWMKQGLSLCFACGNPYKHKIGKIWVDQCCETCEDLPVKRVDAFEALCETKTPYVATKKAWLNPTLTEFERDLISEPHDMEAA